MKKTVKTSEILSVYQIVGNAKYGKMSDEDKIKVWKIARLLKPVAMKFEDDRKDAFENLKPEDCDFDGRLAKAQEYERLVKAKQPTIDVMTTAEYDAFIEVFKDYNKLVGEALKELADKEVELDFEPLSEDAFGKLMASNEWSVAQAMEAGDFICN